MSGKNNVRFFSGEITEGQQTRFNDLFVDIAELQFEVGIDGLDGDDGFFDIFINEDNLEEYYNLSYDGESNSISIIGQQQVTDGVFEDGDEITFEDTILHGLIDNESDEIDDITVEMTGQRVTENRSVSSTTESGTLDVQPRGTGDPEDAVMTLEGVLSENPRSEEFSSLSDGDTKSVEIGGSEDTEIEVHFEGSTRVDPQSEVGSISESESVDIVDANDIDNAVLSVDGQDPVTVSESETQDPDSALESPDTTDVLVDWDESRIGSIEIDYATHDTGGAGDATAEVHALDSDANEIDTIYEFSLSRTGTTRSVSGGEVDLPDGTTSILIEADNTYGAEYVEITSPDPRIEINAQSENSEFDATSDLSEPIDLSPSETVILDYTGPETNFDISYDALHYPTDPSVSLGGETASVDGELLEGETATDSIVVSPGSQDMTVSSIETVGISLNWDDIKKTSNPSVDLAGESVVNSGELAPGETVSQPITLDSGTDYEADINSDGPVKASVEWIDVSDTVDPSISINGQISQYDGVLPEGEMTSIDVDNSWIEQGTNTLAFAMDSPEGKPRTKTKYDITYSSDRAYFYTPYEDLGFVPTTVMLGIGVSSDANVTYSIEDDNGNSFEIPEPDSEFDVSGIETSNIRFRIDVDRESFDEDFTIRNYSIFFTDE